MKKKITKITDVMEPRPNWPVLSEMRNPSVDNSEITIHDVTARPPTSLRVVVLLLTSTINKYDHVGTVS